MMETERALSVSELNEYVRRLLAGDVLLRSVEVTGEISGYKHHISGHRYFSLKDAGARVQCVMFRQNAMSLDFQPKDGMQVRVSASASLFPRDGSYQLYVNRMQERGAGDLYQKFEALKRKLSAEGLFDPAIKREIPLTPRYIGIATSATGAAVRDIIRVARRRAPNVGIILAPCAVQGADAAGEIVAAIQALNRDGRPDVILAGRGGGSMEDLWAFNEECVARAIAASSIPTISCVGHETDFTIADFVADVRAATPSMAAEIAVPVIAELRKTLNGLAGRFNSALIQSNRLRRAQLARLTASPVFRDPQRALIEARRRRVEELCARSEAQITERLRRERARLDRVAAKLQALDPSAVLGRGYACVSVNGHICSSASALMPDMVVQLRFADGSAQAKVLENKPDQIGDKAQ